MNQTHSISPVVIITGASSGIGKALAKAYSEKGWRCALLARRIDRLEVLSQTLPHPSLSIQCDVTQRESLNQAFVRVIQEFGRVDHVLANAGKGISSNIEKCTPEILQNQLDTNLYGVLHTIQAALPYLKITKGQIGIVGSVMGYFSQAGVAPYCISKAAVNRIAESAWFEFSKFGIGVTLITPGFIESEIRQTDRNGNFDPTIQDPVPNWLVMPAKVAAKKIFNAMRRRDREIVLTLHGKLGRWLIGTFPNIFFWLLKKIS